MLILCRFLPLAASLAIAANAAAVEKCPGYVATNIKNNGATLTANLRLGGTACNAYGYDLKDLLLKVEYQTNTRLQVKIYDATEQVYQVPTSVLDPPNGTTIRSSADSSLQFVLTAKPFSFAIKRKASQEVIFDTKGSNLIFESQYLRLRTSLPPNPNIYGLGEDTDAFRRNTTNYTRTLWSRDAYTVPEGTNLYGNHPIYFEHRPASNETHGVFLLNSNGMDIKINNTQATGQYLEYNTLGGIVDLYFLAGPGPADVSRQYSEIVGKPVMMPYWGFGFHQCRYGYQDYIQVAEVVYNYSVANIPLETMWTDIDYMDARKIFTLDPLRFPLPKVQELVTYLHNHNQHYIVMVDPAVAYQNYDAFNNGARDGIFLKNANGSIYKGVVWPGVTAFPDWFNPKTQTYWNNEFDTFFNAKTGVDIDALWIDMNEASNFCVYPCSDPEGFARDNNFPPQPPPVRTTWNPLPGFPADFQPPHSTLRRQAQGSKHGLPGRNLIDPPYMINNAAGSLSNHTINSNLIHANGLTEYDTHNLYGTMMSTASRTAMLSRRPTVRPLIITRSTFAGAGAKVGHWLGDNTSQWSAYRISISELLAFASIYQVPFVGADVCGFALNTTSTLCARWATLGAFYPFYRNHNANDAIDQEFYRWPIVAEAARAAIKARYRLLDFMYTALWKQSIDGTPLLRPLWFVYPKDTKTLGIDLQFFWGDSVLVSPVTEENKTSVSLYLPNDQFYDFFTYQPIRGRAAMVTLDNVDFTQIPVHIRGGSILPLRADGANTTTALRKLDFSLVVAPGLDGSARGSLYLDDGDSIVQKATSEITFAYRRGALTMQGKFGYQAEVKIAEAVFLGMKGLPKQVTLDGKRVDGKAVSFNRTNGAVTVKLGAGLMRGFELEMEG